MQGLGINSSQLLVVNCSNEGFVFRQAGYSLKDYHLLQISCILHLNEVNTTHDGRVCYLLIEGIIDPGWALYKCF